MDTDERFIKNQSMPSFSAANLKQPKHVPKFDFSSIDPFNPQLDQISKKIQSNNQKITQAIGSQKNFLQPMKNFCLPTVSNFNPSDAIHTQRSHFVGTPRKQESPSNLQLKKNESTHSQNSHRFPIAVSPKEEYQKAKIQLDEIRHYLSQPNSKIASPRQSPTQRDGDTDRIPEDLAFLEKGLRARLKLDNDKNRTQSSKFMNKRDTSYIIDALANAPLSVRQSYREISPRSSREIISPNASQTNIDSNIPKLFHSKSTFGASYLNQPLPILTSKGKNSIDIEGQYVDSSRLTPKLEDQKSSQHLKPENEVCTLISLSTGQNQKFTDHLAQNFHSGELDKINSTNYQVKKSIRLQRALSLSYTENPVIPKLGNFSPFRPLKPKEIEKENAEENELIMSLRKECPNIFTPVPPGRQDVVMLSTWIDEKINNVVKSNNLEESEKCMKCDEIYNLGLNEMIRQVSLECVERGELLCKIWTSYYQILLQFKANIALDFEKEKIAYNNNLKDQNDNFQALYREQGNEIEILKQQLSNSHDEITKINLKHENLQEKDMKHKDKIDQLRRVISYLKTQIEDLKHENRTLTRRQVKESDMKKDKKSKPQQQSVAGETSDPREESKYRLNESSTLNISKAKSEPAEEKDHINENGQSKEKSDSGTSTESDDEFAFIDAETNKKIKYNFDQLNNNLVVFRPSKLENKEAQKVREIEQEDKEIQTVISLVSEKYNEVFENQLSVDDLVIEKILKKQVDNFAETTEKLLLEIEAEQQILQQKLREKWSNNELKEQLGSINIPEPVFKSIYNLNEQITTDKQVEKQQLLNVNQNEDYSTPKANIENSNRNNAEPPIISLNYTNTKEDEVRTVGTVGTPRTPRGSILKKGKVGGSVRSLSITRELIEQKHDNNHLDAAVEDQKESQRFTKTVKIAEVKIEENKKEQDSDSKDASTEVQFENNDQSREVNETSQLSTPYMRKATKAFTAGTPSRFHPDAAAMLAEIARSQNNEENPQPTSDTQTSVESDHRNSTQEYKKLSIKIDLDPTPVNSKSETQGSLKVPHQPRRSRLSCGLDLSAPQNGSLNQDGLKNDDIFSEKARLILLARMYKVETEKSKGLQSEIDRLNAQRGTEQEGIMEFEDSIKNLKIKVKKLEKLKDRCIHKVCPICGDQSPVDDDRRLSFDPAGFNDEINEDDNNTPMARAITGSDDRSGIDEDDEDDGSDGGNITRRAKREKSFKKRNVKQTTTAQSPEFKNKKAKEQKVNPSAAIISTIKESGMKKFKNFMPLKSVLKHIFTLYNDRLRDNAIYKDEEFPNFVYTWFLNNFGFKKIAEQKFIVFVLSVKKYLYVVRINLFARFMGLLDGISNHNLDEFTKYLEATEYISKLNLGSPVQNTDTDTKHYIPFLKGADYVKYFAETKMGIEEYAEFRKGIESIKEPDPKGINRNGLMDFDLLMTKVLAKYRIVCSRAKQNVVTAFKAADLDGNKNCSLKEFNILYRNIEAEKYDYSFAEAIFNQHADVNVGGQMNLSFDKFTVVCVEYSLFSDAQQDSFLGVQTKEELADQIQELQQKWERTFESIRENLRIMTSISKQDIEYWESILELLGPRIASIEDFTSQEIKPLLIAYKILFQETEKLKEQDIGVDAYGVKKSKQTSKLNL